MIAENTRQRPTLAALADEACELCVLYAGEAAHIALQLRCRLDRSAQADLAGPVEGALRECLYAAPVSPELYALAHEEEREDIARAIDDGCLRARKQLNGTLDDSAWRGLKTAILYRFAW
ncbi:MAG TPA: hypothetical protein PLP17_06375 [Oligoflexia bacterium]|nr:hypothetical protein [Oligoflexia bacterium]